MKGFPRNTKWFFLICLLFLAGLLYGGSTYLGRKIPSSEKLAQLIEGLPSQFDYLKAKQQILLTQLPPSVPPSKESSGDAQSLIVLCYHGISESPKQDNVGWDAFQQQMYLLKANGYQTVGMADIEDFLLHGKPLPKKSFLLAFDDGRKDSFYPVDPILSVLGYRAVMFVITSTVSAEDDGFRLTEGELRSMTDSGRWELGSHSRALHQSDGISLSGETGHAMSNKLWLMSAGRLESDDEFRQRILTDLALSKRDLESRFGITVHGFAFPFGDYGQDSRNFKDGAEAVIRDVVRSVFPLAFYQPWDEAVVRNYPGLDDFMVRRLEVDPAWTAADLLNTVQGGEDKDPDYSSRMERDDGWTRGWGDTQFTPGLLTLSAASDTTGATSYLDGTFLWKDFDLTFRARLVRGSSFSVLARVDRQKNFAYCSFGRNGVTYGERVNGEEIAGPGWSGDLSLFAGLEIQAGISLQGNEIRCLWNNIPLVNTTVIRHTSAHGMIGLSVWGPEKGGSKLEVLSLGVAEKP
jgi:peptidoglycan/xylan/chitin deacetylase (PgdA/CDA1 family)